MTPCDGGVVPEGGRLRAGLPAVEPAGETCDVCGSGDLAEVRCKVICRNCRTILKSCADL